MADYSTNSRGAPLQGQLTQKRGRPVYGRPRDCPLRAEWAAPRGYLPVRCPAIDPQGHSRADGDSGVILTQNIVAHVLNPAPRLKIAAALAPVGGEALYLDTINKINWIGPYSAEAAVAILNSSLVSWYVYRFIVGRAIRTIHFDSPVTDRIPVPRAIDRHPLEARLAILVREKPLRRATPEALDAGD